MNPLRRNGDLHDLPLKLLFHCLYSHPELLFERNKIRKIWCTRERWIDIDDAYKRKIIKFAQPDVILC